MKPIEVKKACQDVISLIEEVEGVQQKIDTEGCPGCQGAQTEHSVACEAFSEATSRLGEKLLELQCQINGVICHRWAPKGLEFVADQDAINHSFDSEDES